MPTSTGRRRGRPSSQLQANSDSRPEPEVASRSLFSRNYNNHKRRCRSLIERLPFKDTQECLKYVYDSGDHTKISSYKRLPDRLLKVVPRQKRSALEQLAEEKVLGREERLGEELGNKKGSEVVKHEPVINMGEEQPEHDEGENESAETTNTLFSTEAVDGTEETERVVDAPPRTAPQSASAAVAA